MSDALSSGAARGRFPSRALGGPHTHVALVETGADPLAAIVPVLIAAGHPGVAVFNRLPGLPLEGGRLLRATIWWATGNATTATRIAQWTGRMLAGALLVLAVVASASGDTAAAMWAAWLSLAMLPPLREQIARGRKGDRQAPPGPRAPTVTSRPAGPG